jgi:hypothetical protein
VKERIEARDDKREVVKVSWGERRGSWPDQLSEIEPAHPEI